jgi:CheY-like chemotaxis protein
MACRVLIVEDEVLQAQRLEDLIVGSGHTVLGVAKTAEEALFLAKTHRPDVVLMDVALESFLDGIDAAGMIRNVSGAGVIFITGHGGPAVAARIRRQVPDAVTLEKPAADAAILDAIDRAQPRARPSK